MLFNSINFIIFIIPVMLIYYIIPQRVKYIWLLVSSYFFYMSWNVKYAFLMVLSTVTTYICAILLGRNYNGQSYETYKKIIFTIGLLINLGILIIFKYSNFFQLNLDKMLNYLGIECNYKHLNLLLPVGISFYTFQALGYMIDVYRGTIKPEKNILRYALFVSFFPQLVAGPIERSKNLLRQLNEMGEKRLWNYESIRRGYILTLWGFFLKMVMADRIGIFVDEVYGNWQQYGSITLIMASIGFAFQIYCDFGGYTYIAIGISKMMGIQLMDNFNTPYFAQNIRDFWGRWHISLSSWFRDYLYIPLGGSKCSKIRNYSNLLITFLISGLWHGASWHYVVWGGIHGIYQVIGRLFFPLCNRINEMLHINTFVFSYRLRKTVNTFILVTIAWIFFRADSVRTALGILNRIIFEFHFSDIMSGEIWDWGFNEGQMRLLLISFLLLFFVSIVQKRKNVTIDGFLVEQNLVFRWFFMFLLMILILIYGEYGSEYNAQQFVYFQF